MINAIFATDWPLESMRSPINAIMPVGYDTLELCALSAGATVPTKANATQKVAVERRGRLLDLCCGCGIQGIFAWCCSAILNGVGGGCYSDLVCVDVNKRACHFVCACFALNGLYHPSLLFGKHFNDGGSDAGFDMYAKNQDLFGSCNKQPRVRDTAAAAATSESMPHTLGRFSRILANPPFVALPESSSSSHPVVSEDVNDSECADTSPMLYHQSLYAAGGTDGLDIVRRIIRSSLDVLDRIETSNACLRGKEEPQLLMVTEVPNVEESCQMLQSFLPQSSQSSVSICVAYVVDDVETVETYGEERSKERGIGSTDEKHECTKWCQSMEQSHIRNRALVLISLQRTKSGPELNLFDMMAVLKNHPQA
eukprot:CAMPEP_0116012704 /NCGR_PEP_ID=MMETSP0321-20121206/5275_1 /TAXON_ID=163516 /ORGANISM="Leptocylindrus danicus var. danicus, Strain B650" /LENGTH=367 /DNA_ID=CAMNT_0003482085 /DNA_START=62 /DNA_END=1166 /DNA_ORIENTATION=+